MRQVISDKEDPLGAASDTRSKSLFALRVVGSGVAMIMGSVI
jgi:hypothetical protein